MKKAQGERVKEIRKEQNLTLEKFGERIGMKKSSLSQIENGVNALTDTTAKLICKEFAVNEDWLINGTGEKYKDIAKISLDEFAKSRGADELDLKIIKLYLDLKPEVRHAVVDLFFNGMSEKINFDEYSATSKISEGSPKVLDVNTDTELPAASAKNDSRPMSYQEFLNKLEPTEDNSAG